MPEVTVTFTGTDGLERVGSHYKGGSDAVLLMHGLRSDHREFADFPELLAETGLSILALDFTGCGESDGVRGYVSPSAQCADVRAALDFLAGQGVTQTVALGHSFGVHAALQSAAVDDRIVAAIIVAPQSRSGASLTGLRKILFRVWGLFRPIAGALKYVSIPSSKNYDALFVEPSARAWARETDWDPGVYNLGTLAHATGMNNRDVLAGITKPVLAVIGAHDKKTRPEGSLKLFTDLARTSVQTVTLPNSGHSPFADSDKDLLFEVTCNFLADVFAAPNVAIGEQ